MGALKTRLKARNCGSGKIKGAGNCGYVRMKKINMGCFPCVLARFSQLCKLLFLRLLLGFYAFVIVYCCVASEPGQQKTPPRCKNL